jgi:AraC family transcriptional regulator of adaptative response/methylated-DNA-[protein]-cysteine methyltransferase
MPNVTEIDRLHRASHTEGDAVAELVTSACLHIEQHLDEPVTLERLGHAVGASPFHLQRVFKQRTGVSPREYREALRVRALKELLHEGEGVTRAAYEAGFGSLSAAYEAGGSHLGMTPATYGKGGHGATISCSTVDSRLGKLLVAQTERGVCAVTLGDSTAALERALRQEFPRAEIGPSTERTRALCQRLAAWAAHPATTTLNLPLDVRATAFQWRVWRALRAIPPGQAFSYGEVAAAIGQPTAARAVASACASNPVALVIPCHRVVRADGTPGGYRWGVERKQQLLAAESAGQ